MTGKRRRDADSAMAVAAWLVMIIIAAGMVAYAAVRPGANTDLIFYAATVHQWEGLDTEAIHAASLADAREYLGADAYEAMVTENDYMRTVAADPEALVQQIPFYSVKVLFPALMIGLRGVGMSLGFAQLFISLSSYFALSIVVFLWMWRHHPPLMALLVAGLISFSSPWAVLARIQSPDALGLALSVSALFLILELRRPSAGFVLLLTTILVRPNAVILLVAVIFGLALLHPATHGRVRWPTALAWSTLGIGLAAALIVVSGNYGNGVLFYHAVVEYLPYPAQGSPHLSLGEIIRIYGFKLATIWSTQIPLFMLVGLLAIRLRVADLSGLRTDARSVAVLAVIVSMLAGYLTYPNEPERILAPPFLICLLILAASSAPLLQAGRRAIEGNTQTSSSA